MLIAALSYGKFEIIQLQREESGTKSNRLGKNSIQFHFGHMRFMVEKTDYLQVMAVSMPQQTLTK